MKNAETDKTNAENTVVDATTGVQNAQNALEVLKVAIADANAMEEGKEQAEFYRDTVFTAMAALRTPIDELEMLVDKEYWPVPSYGDMLFEV